jgi:WD40 repeat protein
MLGKLLLSGTPERFQFAGPDTLLVLAVNFRPGLPTLHTVSRWNVATSIQEWEVPCPPADWLAVSPDGKRFAITNRWEGHVAYLYCAITGKRESVPTTHDGAVTWVGFSPDGGTITTANEHAIWNWNLKGDGKPVATEPELSLGPRALTCLGEKLVWTVPAEEGKKAELVGWDEAKSAIGWRMQLDGKAPDRVYSHDGKRVVGLTWNAEQKMWDVTVHDGPSGKKLHAWTMKNIPVWDSPWPVSLCRLQRRCDRA